MNFWILTPPPPVPGYPFWGGGGVKTTLCIATVVRGFGPRSGAAFFFYMDPLTYGGVLGPNSGYPPPPTVAPCQ